jgi:cathepsin H
VVALALIALRVATATPLTMSFADYMVTFNKAYPAEELSMRHAVFRDNLRVIEETNAQNLSYTLGVNEYTDLLWSEFTERFLMAPQHCSATEGNFKALGVGARDDPSIDWRTKGVVTAVKNQGSCGSCWAFSTTGCVESHWALTSGQLIILSEQQLVDCAGAFGNMGCRGGLPSQAFEYIKAAGGIERSVDYPYTGRDGSCRVDKTKFAAHVTGEVNITEGAEKDLFDAVTNVGPVSIAFQVVGDFQSYRSGVYDSTRCRKGPMDVNHAVLAVGYGTDASSKKPYWIVKNSWGASWGMQGYFNIVRDKNMCGLATCASYPLTK